MTGRLYGIGVGPGEAELMTIKAARLISECDVIAVPQSGGSDTIALRIAGEAVPELSTKPVIEVDMPMTRNSSALESYHSAAADAIENQLRDGKSVAFLTLGDPTVYSTYIYIHRLIQARGYDAEIIPGVTSFCAVAARIGVALGETRYPIHILPGSYDGLAESLMLPGTKVIMKSGQALKRVKEQLNSANMLDSSIMVENCGFSNERVVRNLAGDTHDAGYFSVIIVPGT